MVVGGEPTPTVNPSEVKKVLKAGVLQISYKNSKSGREKNEYEKRSEDKYGNL